MELKITDVSFAGSSVAINKYPITDFMDDANPIEVQDVETCNIEWSCNGRMIRTIKPAAVIISITVIPGSNSDKYLRSVWFSNYCNGGNVDTDEADKPISCQITTGWGYGLTFSSGTCVAGAAALTSNAQGKMGGNTYTFAFEETKPGT